MITLGELRGFQRYARGLGEFLSHPMSEVEARERIAKSLACRERSFLTLLEGSVYRNPRSPYFRLLAHAGIELADVARMVESEGIETALSRLHDAGVWLSLAEAKGKEPVRRGSLELRIDPRELHNSLAARHFEAATGGSRSAGTSFWVDIDDVLHAAAYAVLARREFGLTRAEGALWFPAPPGVAGMRRALWWSKAGMVLRRWFAQSVPRWRPGEIKRAAFVQWTVLASRRAGRPLPVPEHTPPADAVRVARWLAERVREGNPAVFFGPPSAGLRACSAAGEAGLDLTGTFFSFGGEPYTEAKARAIERAGCRAESSYYISELGGPIAVGCPKATQVDEAHLVEDRIARIVKQRTLACGTPVRPLYFTTLSARAPQVAINLESGDLAVETRSTCGCAYAEAGLTRTLHGIRSYEKLSTEGMHFVGPELVTLLEEVLPRRFGGGPTDYQLVEEEDEEGRSRLDLAVSPRLGPLDEARLAEAALGFLQSRGAAESMMAEIWRSGGTLRVVRREPVVSRAAKVLPLHVSRSPASRRASGSGS